MVTKIQSLGLFGMNGYPVQVECCISQGLPGFEVVGLPDAAVKESRERVRAAVKHGGFLFPVSHITVNLAPADRKKEGTVYDLPVLVGLLCASSQLPAVPKGSAFIGELSLGGELRPIRGVLPMALAAVEAGIKELYVPAANAPEAALADGLTVYGVENVWQLAQHLFGREKLTPAAPVKGNKAALSIPDFQEVKGQERAKRALEIAAAGGHNVLMVGPPGAGKSMLAKRLPAILPDLTWQESLAVTKVHSIAGALPPDRPLVETRPFRAPHHTISPAGLTGGGSVPKPGEVSLAHNGVLFLDELPEFHADALEVLRQPLEDGEVQISRVAGTMVYPSRFMLVCAMNPCKCGWFGHPSGRCNCSPNSVRRYLSKLSGPLLDRIDIQVDVQALEFDELSQRRSGESSEVIRRRVNEARERQVARYGENGPQCNAHMGQQEMGDYCALDEAGQTLMRSAYERMGLTARSYDRILRVARTIADLDGEEKISPNHLAEAIQYRQASCLRLLNN